MLLDTDKHMLNIFCADHGLDNYNGGEEINLYLERASDLYDDDDINIIDIVALVNLVMDINLN